MIATKGSVTDSMRGFDMSGKNDCAMPTFSGALPAQARDIPTDGNAKRQTTRRVIQQKVRRMKTFPHGDKTRWTSRLPPPTLVRVVRHLSTILPEWGPLASAML